MALKPENPVVGGTALRRAAIRSPNYVAGLTGWTINIDGSAEFNNLTIRGTFKGNDFILDATGFYLYSGAPALGNLILSVTAAAGTDPEGNTVPAAGVTSYASSTQWSNLNAAVLSFQAAAGQPSDAGIASNAAGQLVLESGQVAGGDTQAELALLSAQANAGQALVELLANSLVQGNLTVTGTLSVNGSTSTGNGSNGGVTSGPSGTVSSFPAAGPNHTHAETHTHPL